MTTPAPTTCQLCGDQMVATCELCQAAAAVEVILTDHAIERLKERVGLNRKAGQRTAEKAYHHGTPPEATTGDLRTWLECLRCSATNATNLRLYGQHLYLFKGAILITVYWVPKEHLKSLPKIKR